MPRISQAPVTSGRTGTLFSSTTTATFEALAISLRIVPTPPRVASRRARTPAGTASRRAETSPCSGAVSEVTSDSMSSSPRASMIVTP